MTLQFYRRCRQSNAIKNNAGYITLASFAIRVFPPAAVPLASASVAAHSCALASLPALGNTVPNFPAPVLPAENTAKMSEAPAALPALHDTVS